MVCALDAYFVVENLILILHTGHEGVLRQSTSTTAILLICTCDLLLQSLHIRRKQSIEFESFPFLGREGGAFVVIWRFQQGKTLQYVSLTRVGTGFEVSATDCESTLLRT